MLQTFFYPRNTEIQLTKENSVTTNHFQQLSSQCCVLWLNRKWMAKKTEHCVIFGVSHLLQSRSCPPVVITDSADSVTVSVSSKHGQIQDREWFAWQCRMQLLEKCHCVNGVGSTWKTRHQCLKCVALINFRFVLSVTLLQVQIYSAFPRIISKDLINLGLYEEPKL